MDKHIGELIATYLLETGYGQPMHPDLEAWLAESPSNQTMLEEYKNIWQEISNYSPELHFNSARVWEKIHHVNEKKKEQRNRLLHIGYAIAGVAASVVIFLSLFQYGYIERSVQLVEVNTFTGNGNRSEIVLPDGTHVKLNTGTTLHYVYDKKKKSREIQFEGEAFLKWPKAKYLLLSIPPTTWT
ncbi:MAG: FecR domain-containing protein [Tannerellaceae bacterium]|nr:FecR domain-containing protein [Tannerellaceae bacterium]MCD8263046.1 FecR domain-containing protein [Tannerellaceae bacterium]